MGRISKYLSIDKNHPTATANCDRCGFFYNHNKLNWQWEYRGTGLVNLNILVCPKCLDVPNPQLKVIILPPDPVPIKNPRVFDREAAMNDYRITQAEDKRLTEDDNFRIEDGSAAYVTGIPD
jgi:hypothetical protein